MIVLLHSLREAALSQSLGFEASQFFSLNGSLRLPAPVLGNIPAVVPQHQIRQKPGPTGLLSGAKPLPVFAMKIFMEQDQVFPMWIIREGASGWIGWNQSIRVAR